MQQYGTTSARCITSRLTGWVTESHGPAEIASEAESARLIRHTVGEKPTDSKIRCAVSLKAHVPNSTREAPWSAAQSIAARQSACPTPAPRHPVRPRPGRVQRWACHASTACRADRSSFQPLRRGCARTLPSMFLVTGSDDREAGPLPHLPLPHRGCPIPAGLSVDRTAPTPRRG